MSLLLLTAIIAVTLLVFGKKGRRGLFRLLNADDIILSSNRLKFNITYTLAYGKDPEQNDADFREILDLADGFAQALTNSTWIVDIFLILSDLPGSLAPWKKFGDKFFARTQEWFENNTSHALSANFWSWTKRVTTTEQTGSLTLTETRSLTGVLFEAGVDAVVRARKELDDVVGQSRLPTPQDVVKMPYVKGFFKEVLRCRPILQGLPHHTTAPDSYMGYEIPNGTTVLFHNWGAHQDENLYPGPALFRPECFVETPGLPLGVFGYFGEHARADTLH
ncbi:uncharacterized protein N7498_003450 [Penicillium cinerascens]|uniref:Uncharacterized protein n=1 Tax=Penicillium cinerascens TaxID=70096 RepID=A0A9W9T754_9EURO|nr:uncharacterized protein N7498_003450 [Penicillium cinerascens]KAJ5211804.1 hypothetical protein N7498_003450 [Penicillium cinerascens]